MAHRPFSLAHSHDPVRAGWRFDVSDAIDLPGFYESAVSVIAPACVEPDRPIPLLVCLPGGFLSRQYFDLHIPTSARHAMSDVERPSPLIPSDVRRYSFAEAMVGRGFVVLTIDHIGTGESSKPNPVELGYEIGVETIARANDHALRAARGRLALGDPAAGLPPILIGHSIGLGHSMGSMLTIEQQALSAAHDALVLFSFSTQGAPRFLDDSMRGYANDPKRLRREIGSLARLTMGSPYPERATNSEDDRRAAFGVGTAPSEAEGALHLAATNLLAVGGLTSMVPDGFAPPAEQIDVPVLMIVGDHDLHDDRHTREELPNAPSVTTYTLEDCWHCHFVANTRETLWRVVSEWIEKQTSGLP